MVRTFFMSNFLISYNFIKLLEPSLHAQNAVRLQVLCPIYYITMCTKQRTCGRGAGKGEGPVEGGEFLVESRKT
jgi:hypothetical protein